MRQRAQRPLPRNVAVIETAVALAHKHLSRARDAASSLSDLGLHDDLQLHLLELERLQVDLLRGRPHRPLLVSNRAYLYDTERNDSRPAT
jgi:hypothetical protein